MMKKVLMSFVALAAIAAAAAGPVRGQNANPDVTLDFTTNTWGLPTSNTMATESYTDGTYSITLSATYAYKFNSGYLLLGKSGSYLQLPAFSSPVEKIEVVGNSGASSQVKQNIYVGETAVSTQTTGATGTNTYVINENYRAAGNIYTLKVESAHNTQITYIKVYYVSSGGGSEPEQQPALYTVKMAPGTEDSTSWTFNPGEAATTGVAEGTVVNISYGGTRKVKEVVATVVPNAPAAPAGETVTWNSSNVFNSAHMDDVLDSWSPNPRTYEGITISGSELDYSYFRAYDGVAQTGKLSCRGDEGESFTFTAPSGKKFCKIEIINDEWSINFVQYGDWTQPEDNKVVWSGTAASTVTLGTVFTSASNLNSIVFTLVDAN